MAHATTLRMLLCEIGFFGPVPFADQLERAYAHYRGFCRHHRIRQSQPPFLPRTVS